MATQHKGPAHVLTMEALYQQAEILRRSHAPDCKEAIEVLQRTIEGLTVLPERGPRHVTTLLARLSLACSIATPEYPRFELQAAVGALHPLIKDLVSQHAGILTSWLTAELANLYPSDECMEQVQCPTLIVHGAVDRVIPCDQARKLYKKAAAGQKRLVVLEGIGHHGIDLHFAVAHECPRLFNLNVQPRYMDIDGYLADPAMQGDTVASPVPVFDCRSRTWSRPTLERGSKPFLRQPPEGSAAHAYQQPEMHDTAANRYPSAGPGTRPDELGGLRQTDSKGNTTGYIVTGVPYVLGVVWACVLCPLPVRSCRRLSLDL